MEAGDKSSTGKGYVMEDVEKPKAPGRGMVLPFTPLALTFKDMHYYVALPKARWRLFSISSLPQFLSP